MKNYNSLSLLLFCKGSFIEGMCCECKKSHKSQQSLNVVNEINVMEVAALINGILGLNTINGKRKNGVCSLTVIDRRVEVFITVLAFDVTDFVVPPHNRFPIRLIIFKENSVIIWVFSKSSNNILCGSSLTPLDTLESENFQCLSNVHYGSFFSCLIFKMNFSSWCIIIFWKHMDSTFRKL